MDFQFRVPPFPHQLKEWEHSRELPLRALFWEQGVGKTKPTLETGAWLYLQKKIDCIIVIAPDGVHRNWITEEVPKHMPEAVLQQCSMHIYQTAKARTKQHAAQLQSLLKHRGLAILAITYDAIMTEPGRKAVWEFLKKRRVLYVADESGRIKNPGAKRTKRVVASAAYAPYRRVLNGTPVPNGPFDIYSQLKFLDDKFWLQHGVGTFLGFKNVFGIFRRQTISTGGREHSFDQLVGYREMDRLKRIVDTVSSRLTKEEVLPDLPPKLFSRRGFDLTSEQSKLYKQLVEEFLAELDSGECVTAPLAIVRLLRLQQVTCGFLPTESEDEPIHVIPGGNPRLEMLEEIAVDLPHPAIIWARFRRDIDQILECLAKNKLTAVRYDGSCDDAQRAEAFEKFQKSGEAQFFVANPQAAGMGLTLTNAQTVIYYSNNFNLMDRLQSEDRAHRIGQKHAVNYIDLIANGTIDLKIVASLVEKLDLASQLTGDKLRTWL